MLNRTFLVCSAVAAVSFAVVGPAAAQELAPHRAVYQVFTLDHGKPSGASGGTYAYELRQTCEGVVMNLPARRAQWSPSSSRR